MEKEGRSIRYSTKTSCQTAYAVKTGVNQLSLRLFSVPEVPFKSRSWSGGYPQISAAPTPSHFSAILVALF
jgi:hypothetical protein